MPKYSVNICTRTEKIVKAESPLAAQQAAIEEARAETGQNWQAEHFAEIEGE